MPPTRGMRLARRPFLVWFLLINCYCLREARCLTSLFDPDEDRVVQLFQEEDQKGNESVTLYWHTPKLTSDWTSLQQSGIWIYYSEENYTGQNVTAVFGEDVSINIFHPLKSVRYAGNARGSTFPAVILYKDTWFRGMEYHVEVAEPDELLMVPNFRDMGSEAKSMIIVGSPFTTFPKQNFRGGQCWCLRPTHFAVTTGDEVEMVMASFYPDLASDLGQVGSLMMTCEDVPMKNLCDRLPDEDVNRSRCPVLTNGRVEYCG